jgi:plastocyanin
MISKRGVNIVLITLFVTIFLVLGTYIGLKENQGEKIIDFGKNLVINAADGAKEIVPTVTIKPEEVSPNIPSETKKPIEESPAEVALAKSESNIIEIKDTKFYPTELEIKLGEKVTWINKDLKHNYQVYERSDNQLFNSLQLMPGSEFSYVFNETGTFYFSDAIFKYMKGQIVVTR